MYAIQKNCAVPKDCAAHEKTASLKQPVPVALNSIQMLENAQGNIQVVRKRPPIKYLVLEGGGTKGLCYPAFLKKLNEEMPFLNSLREVAGTSAGAITAYLLATGVSLSNIEKYLLTVDVLKEFQGSSQMVKKRGRGIFEAGNLIETLHRLSLQSIKEYFNEHPEQYATLAGGEKYKGLLERWQLNQGLTFADLALLHELDPAKFKLLNVTLYNTSTRKAEYFNAEKHSEIFCLEAVRASMAIPRVFQSVIIDGQEFSDGGQADNAPIAIFKNRKDYSPAETVLLAFHRKGKVDKILHHPPVLVKEQPDSPWSALTLFANKIASFCKNIFNKIAGFFGRQKKDAAEQPLQEETYWHGGKPSLMRAIVLGKPYLEAKKQERDNIHALGLNVLAVPHKGLGTFSLRANAQVLETAKEKAIKAAERYAEIHKDSYYYTTYQDWEEAINSLSDQERAQLSPHEGK